MKSVALSLLVVVAAMPLAVSAAPPEPWDPLCNGSNGVVPGSGIGSVHLGDSFMETVKRLGGPFYWLLGRQPFYLAGTADPTASLPEGDDAPWHDILELQDPTQGREVAAFGSGYQSVTILATNDKINLIRIVRMPACTDPSGITTNTPASVVLAKYGEQYSIRANPVATTVVYDAAGIAFSLSFSVAGFGPVRGMQVFPANHFCEAIGRTACGKYLPALK